MVSPASAILTALSNQKRFDNRCLSGGESEISWFVFSGFSCNKDNRGASFVDHFSKAAPVIASTVSTTTMGSWQANTMANALEVTIGIAPINRASHTLEEGAASSK